jgi:uncharacterized protein YecT (DUF1311 family)
MKHLALAFTLSLVAGAVGAQKPTCERNTGGVFEDISCAAAALELAEHELAATYSQLLAILPAPEAAALRKAQDAWLRFVEADVLFVEAREGAGSAGRLVIANSRERLTSERTLELKSWTPR